MKTNYTPVITAALIASMMCSRADVIYSIPFDNYAIGTTFPRGSAPAEFTGTYYHQGPDSPPFASAEIVSSALGLTDQPLLQHTLSANESVYYVMSLADTGNMLIQLAYQLALDGTSEASVEFLSDISGEDLTWLFAHFNGDTVTISSRSGVLYNPTILFETSVAINRAQPMALAMTLDTLNDTFTFSINDAIIATEAPLGSSQPFTRSVIGLGDVMGATGGYGDSAIDSILLDVSVVPEPGTLSLLTCSIVALSLFRRHTTAQQAGSAYGAPGARQR